MDWKSLNKEQKQMVILALLGVVTFLYVGKAFILAPMNKKWDKAKADIKELEDKVRTAERFNREDGTVKTKISRNYHTLASLEKEFLADEQNTFAWAAGQAYSIGREVNLELEVTDAKIAGRTTGSATSIANFVPYSINVNTVCSYDELVILLGKFQNTSPYTSIANLSILASPSDYTRHAVSFKVQWPLFQNPKKRTKILKS